MSIRNQIPGTVRAVTPGTAMAVVTVALAAGGQVVAAVTREAVDDLGLTAGVPVRALIKSTDIALATGPVDGVSIRNRIPGSVASLTVGPAMTMVKVAVAGGELTAVVTSEAVSGLGLVAGSEVVALVKSTEVSLATV